MSPPDAGVYYALLVVERVEGDDGLIAGRCDYGLDPQLFGVPGQIVSGCHHYFVALVPARLHDAVKPSAVA